MSTLILGDVLEGGGQILRIAISLSALLGKDVVIKKIRAGRKKPGLAAQHLKGVQLVQKLSNAKLEGASMGSMELFFSPWKLKSGSFTVDMKTAGSVALLLQIALPCCLFGDGVSYLNLRGGTNAEMAPPIEFTTRVFLPTLKKFGVNLDFEIKRRGFFPVGKGEVIFSIPSLRKLMATEIINFGNIEDISGEVFFAGKFSQQVAEEIALSSEKVLRSALAVPVRINIMELNREEAFGNGCGINLLAKTSTGCLLGASQLKRDGVSPQEVGRLAAEELLQAITIEACVDQHLQDQLIVMMALATGTSAIRTGPITLHTETAMHICTSLSKAYFRIKKDGDCNVIECDGIGLNNTSF